MTRLTNSSLSNTLLQNSRLQNSALLGVFSSGSGGDNGGGGSADVSLAQGLARVGHPAETIENQSGVSASVAQMNARRHGTR